MEQVNRAPAEKNKRDTFRRCAFNLLRIHDGIDALVGGLSGRCQDPNERADRCEA